MVMTMENAVWQVARTETGRDPLMNCLGPVFNSLSFSHGGEILVGIKAWPGYLKSFIHQACYSASVSDHKYLIKNLVIYPELHIVNALYSY